MKTSLQSGKIQLRDKKEASLKGLLNSAISHPLKRNINIGIGRKIIFLFPLFFLCALLSQAQESKPPKVGIWYSTWYANEGNYVWGRTGVNTENQFLGDMNGDGRSDAVLYQNGSWKVALSNGEKFGSKSEWASGHGVGSNQQFLADVNGDGLKDAITFFKNSGSFYVAINNGSRLTSYSLWKSGIGVNSSSVLVADVNGDKKEDVVAFYNNTGTWKVARSSGSAFSNEQVWINGHGTGSAYQLLGDVNGDAKSDALVVFPGNGSAFVALSSGTFFKSYSNWMTNDLVNKNSYILHDINNDKKADLIGYDNQSGVWNKALSTGSSFGKSALWKYNDGNRKRNQSKLPVKNFIATVDQTGLPSSIAYVMEWGEWRVLPNKDYYRKPSILNTWQARLIKYKPLINGVAKQYDSKDPAVIDHHLQMLSDAGIHFLLLDLTNNIYVDNGYIASRAKAVAKRIKVWNEAHPAKKLYYAIAIGGVQFSGNVSQIEKECKMVYQDFISNPDLGGSSVYYHHTGKPYIACYYGKAAYRQNWQSYNGSKLYASKFDFRWMNGSKDPSNPQNTFADVAYYPGWGLPASGEQKNDSVMVAMPGWNNHQSKFVSRSLNGVEGAFYQKRCWDRIIDAKPGMIVINSFNEFGEETAVEPANTNALEGDSEKWKAPGFYWNLTLENLKKLKNNSPEQTPYSGTAIPIPGTIQAENFDKGGEGKAYHDQEPVNLGAHYRTEGVDIEPCGEGGYSIGWIQQGEWLKYSINILESGSYNLNARIASAMNGGSFRVELDGQSVATLTFAGTGGWQNWKTVSASMQLPAGKHMLKILALSSEFNLNYFSILKKQQGVELPLESGAVYSILSQLSLKSLDIEGVSLNDGAVLQQYDYWNQARNQHFQLIHVAEGYYRIKPVHSGKCLDVKGGSTQNGASIIQWSCHNKDNQLWKFDKQNDGSYKITSKSSGKVLDLSESSVSNGATIQLWNWTGKANQRWVISPSTSVQEKKVAEGFESREGASTVLFYPNPVQTTFTLQVTDDFVGGKVTLTNSLGVTKEYSIKSSTDAVDVSDLKQGEYIIQFFSPEGKRLVKKLIKQ